MYIASCFSKKENSGVIRKNRLQIILEQQMQFFFQNFVK